jgi:protein-disulfide isomerase
MMNRRQMLATTVAGAATIAISGGESFAQRVPTVADVLYDKEIPVLGNPNGNVRLVLKDWIIFGDNSAYPARLVLAAEKSGNYVKAMEAMMLTPGRLTKDQTDAALKKGGLDPKKLEADYKADAARIDGILARNMEQGEAFNFGGTPSFVIGTRLYGGVMNERSLIDAIKEARKA